MRTHWKTAGANIGAQILAVQLADGPYSAVTAAMRLGYDYPDPPCPLHEQHAAFTAAGDPLSANMMKNSDINRWNQETLAIETVAARRDWAKNTSLAGDRATDVAAIEKQRAEDRERFAVTRANEQLAQETFRAHEQRLEQARKEFDQQHPAPSAKKEAKAS